MGFRMNYWSCSKFADWVRGTKKLSAGTSEEWNAWTRQAKVQKLRFWLAEELLDGIQNTIHWPTDALYSATYWINNLFIEKTHLCRTGLSKGQWHETDERIMFGMFEELRWFIAEQKSWMEFCSHSKEYKNLPFWKHVWPFRHFTNFDYPDLGLKYLEWEMSLTLDESWFGYPKGEMPPEKIAEQPDWGKPTHQAIAAKEIFELYYWWVNVRPLRPDPHDAGGWTEHCDAMREKDGDNDFSFLSDEKTPEEKERCKVALDKTHEIETAYDEEDTLMMKRLIDVRKSLWT